MTGRDTRMPVGMGMWLRVLPDRVARPGPAVLAVLALWALLSCAAAPSFAAAIEVVVDNDTPGVMDAWTGSWSTSSGPNPYGATSKYTTQYGATAVWTPTLPQAGLYQVYVWYTTIGDRDEQAPYVITHAYGTSEVTQNQKVNGGQWNLLGTYCFEAGTSGKVTLTRRPGTVHGGHTNADAVKFVYVPPTGLSLSDSPLDAKIQPAPANIMFVLDDSGSMDWEFMTPQADGVFYGRLYVFDDPGDNVYSWVLTGSHRGYWKSQWWGYNRIYYNPTVTYTPWPSTTTYPMADADPDTPRSHPAHASPTFDLNATYHTINVTPSGAVIVDNKDGGFSRSSSWYESSATPEYNSSSYYTTKTGKWARWTPDLPAAGNYDVYAFWTCGQNQTGKCTWSRDESAPYRIVYNGGSTTVSVNQRYNYGQWNLLASGLPFNAGRSGYVYLEHKSGHKTTSADAVMFVPSGSAISSGVIINAHYYTFDDKDGDGVLDTGEDVYLVNLTNPIQYYLVDDKNSNERVEGGELTPVAASAVPPTVKTYAPPTAADAYARERQNFANWYSYYRRRELSATAAVASVIDGVSGVRIGIRSINGKIIQPVLDIDTSFGDHTEDLLNTLYSYNISAQGTPLRRGLQMVGQYFHAADGKTGGVGSSPIASAADGGECQQNFAIVMTDGYYNGSSPGVGNVDGNNGAPYADSYGDTLADVAMYYYENDLAPSLNDQVPATDEDPATHQHMVTYGISFGVVGTLNPADYDIPGGVYPTWPDPYAPPDLHRIDDLWHATVNGHGTFVSAGNPAELTSAILAVLQNIESRSGSSAAVAVNGDELYESIDNEIRMFQSVYNTDGWWGDLIAYGLDTDSGEVLTDAPLWAAATVLENFLDTNGHDKRLIATMLPSGTGVPFRYASLDAGQRAMLSPDPATAQDILAFLRGDNSLEAANGGSFRDRVKRLGDIVHSMAAYDEANDLLFVGANDGMLHAFDPATGVERFAYVPNLVFANLADLASSAYSHRYYVDLTPTVARMGSTTYVVGGLGKGGKGYYCLDVTDAAAITDEGKLAARVKWEFPASLDPLLPTTAPAKQNMGYSFSQPYVLKSNYTSLNSGTDLQGYVVLFGNGYGSANGHAVLYAVDPADGSLVAMIDTGAGGDNGLSSPAAIDVDNDFDVDFVYAGDLKGNLWKFDLRDPDPSKWGVAHQSGGAPAPLFTVKNAVGECGAPAITSRPDIMAMSACVAEDGSQLPGYMVVFGTGRYLGDPDLTDTTQQAIYGVWDYGDGDDPSEFLGTFDPSAAAPLSNLSAPVTLLQQTDVFNGETVVADFTATEVDTPNSAKVAFFDQSSGSITSRFWDLDGDGVVDSYASNPVYLYTSPGTYQVTLVVVRSTPLPYVANAKTAVVTVSQPWEVSVATDLDGPTTFLDTTLAANFEVDGVETASGAKVTFGDMSASTAADIVAWQWDFGDGTTSTEQSPTHEYASTGTYTVSLTVTDGDGLTDTKTKTDYITVSHPWRVNIELAAGTASYQDIRVLSDNTIRYCPVADGDAGQSPNPGVCSTDPASSHAGWYFDLPDSGERVISDVFIRDGRAIVVSFVPQATQCSTGGYSYVHELDACSGARLSSAVFDINADKLINEADMVTIADPDTYGNYISVAPTAIRFEGRLQPPAILMAPPTKTEIKYFSTSAGNIVTQREKGEQRGMFYWMQAD